MNGVESPEGGAARVKASATCSSLAKTMVQQDIVSTPNELVATARLHEKIGQKPLAWWDASLG